MIHRPLMSALTALVAVALPADCPVCRGPLGRQEGGICLHCWDEVSSRGEGGPSGRLIDSMTVLGPYEGRLGAIVRCFKFGGLEGLGRPLGERLAGRLLVRPVRVDRVVPVPLHWRRRWHRGYNQAEGIAARVARALGRPLDRGALRRTRATRAQRGRTRRERIANVRGAFTARGHGLEKNEILLVDDVVTTGATIRECARALRSSGATRVHVAAAAWTPEMDRTRL